MRGESRIVDTLDGRDARRALRPTCPRTRSGGPPGAPRVERPRRQSQASSGCMLPPRSMTEARSRRKSSSFVHATPPMRSACPPMYFVAECSDTSKPRPIGVQRYGDANVLSTADRTPASRHSSGERRQVRDGGRRIHDRLAVEEVGAGEGVAHLVEVRGVHERRLDAEARQDVPQHRHGAAVERRARHDPRTRARDGEEQRRDGRPCRRRIRSRTPTPRGRPSRIGTRRRWDSRSHASTRSPDRRSGSRARTPRSSRIGRSRTGRSGTLLDDCSGSAGRCGCTVRVWNRRRFPGSLMAGSLLRPSSRVAVAEIDGEARDRLHHLRR